MNMTVGYSGFWLCYWFGLIKEWIKSNRFSWKVKRLDGDKRSRCSCGCAAFRHTRMVVCALSVDQSNPDGDGWMWRSESLGGLHFVSGCMQTPERALTGSVSIALVFTPWSAVGWGEGGGWVFKICSMQYHRISMLFWLGDITSVTTPAAMVEPTYRSMKRPSSL